MENLQKNTFWLSYIADIQAENKFRLVHEKIMNLINYLHINNYSQQIENIILIIASVSLPEWKEQERLVFRRKNKEIEIYINLDYQKILQASENQVLEMIAETYLQAIKRFLSKRKDFDHQRFYSDLENLFIQHGYLLTKT